MYLTILIIGLSLIIGVTTLYHRKYNRELKSSFKSLDEDFKEIKKPNSISDFKKIMESQFPGAEIVELDLDDPKNYDLASTLENQSQRLNENLKLLSKSELLNQSDEMDKKATIKPYPSNKDVTIH